MPAVLTVLVVLVFLALAGGVVYLWLRLRETSRREALQALAARRGWALTISEQKLGRPGVLRLMPRGGPTWTAETRRIESALPTALSGTAAAKGKPDAATEYVAAEPHRAEGLLIVAPRPADPGPEPAPGASLDSAEGAAFLARTVGPDMTNYGAVLSRQPAPDSLYLLGSDPTHRLDLGDLAKLMDGCPPMGPAGTGHPVVIIGPDGLRLRLRHGISRADQMEAFIDFAHDVARFF